MEEKVEKLIKKCVKQNTSTSGMGLICRHCEQIFL